MKQLQFHGIVSYPPHVEALRSALEAVVGVRPDILCERIEVPEVRWQMAVESMLGNRRFSILVPPDTYDDVLQFIEQSKADSRFHYARVLDLERVWQQQRPAISQSLALQVSTEDPYVQAYVNSVLGSIITCTSAREVRKYDRAITTELVYYSEWAVQKLSEKDYVRWFVGRRALDSQIEACERELNQIRNDLLLQATLHSHVKEQKARLDYKDSLSILRPNLENPPEDGYLRLEITDLIEKVQALDLSTVQRLEQEIQNLIDLIRHYEQEKAHGVEEQGRRSATLDALDRQWALADTEEKECEKEVSAIRERLPEAEELAQALFIEQRKERDLSQVIANASKAAKSYTTQANDTAQEMQNLRLEYNIKYHFSGIPEAIHDRRYNQEHERLSATELPRYKAQIQQALQEADEELREHILHNLRERIQYAKDELRRMNDALRASVFRGDRYQFCWDVASEMKEYYRLIDDSQLLGTNPLFESTFYEQNHETFDRFYAELMRESQGDREKQSKAILTDYRTYLTYDLDVTHSDGRVSRLSKIVGETSGGETQTPFYLAIAASFVQLYRMLDLKSSRRLPPTIRLAVFDEAFNRMDEERIGVTLDLFRQFHLQVITATPLERCEYLVPKMCTSIVVARVGENIVLDDYHNYKAKLEETYGENDA
ncbi:SbcC/MukB-like Walker B domain-containing protein [Dictyobacter arantiisoli]|uniref:Uncharacterized protein n=1 Tax=Dictyobacter arantiisoli TaxID=2014874 RepID=A0A5A5TKI7_9CHLR|nr:SbcC/MukB-like Walker B domain-containing protein [Dictyobacter arantiisoli]GCF11977.1 hypothetical protein KDI_55410 [Dictyobacter arantiisoli]